MTFHERGAKSAVVFTILFGYSLAVGLRCLIKRAR